MLGNQQDKELLENQQHKEKQELHRHLLVGKDNCAVGFKGIYC